MSLLSIIQAAAIKCGLPSPNLGVGNADLNVQQLIGFANEEGQELAARHSWQVLTTEAHFLTTGAEAQGTIQTLAGPGFSFVLNETMWNRDQRRPVFGPRSPAEWQQLKAQFMQGPWYQYRIRGNQVIFLPVPSAGFNIYFEWVSQFWATATGGLVGTQTSLNIDTDVSVLDERLISLGCIWRWKEKNRFAYDEAQEKYEDAISDAITRDGSKPRLNLLGQQTDIYPGIIVPAGNWTL
jgi:hypothetical protein